MRTRNQLGQGSWEGCSSQREQDVQRPVGRENTANLIWVVWLGWRVRHKMSRKEWGSWAWRGRALFSGVLLHIIILWRNMDHTDTCNRITVWSSQPQHFWSLTWLIDTFKWLNSELHSSPALMQTKPGWFTLKVSQSFRDNSSYLTCITLNFTYKL